MRQRHDDDKIYEADQYGTLPPPEGPVPPLPHAMPNTMAEASEAPRGLIEAVRLVSENSVFKIELYGELAALLSLGQNH